MRGTKERRRRVMEEKAAAVKKTEWRARPFFTTKARDASVRNVRASPSSVAFRRPASVF